METVRLRWVKSFHYIHDSQLIIIFIKKGCPGNTNADCIFKSNTEGKILLKFNGAGPELSSSMDVNNVDVLVEQAPCVNKFNGRKVMRINFKLLKIF